MKEDIKEKLQRVLSKNELEDTDVVFILSRVRKLLEVDESKRAFKALNFYCNWALHVRINDTDPVSKILEEPGSNVISLMHLYPDFDREFRKFLSEHSLTTKIFDSRKAHIKFHHLLSEIYSGTPLIVGKKKITFTKIDSFGENSGFFSAAYEDT